MQPRNHPLSVLRLAAASVLALALGAAAMPPKPPPPDPDNLLYIDLAKGRVVVEMRPDLAPQHVARIKELVRKGYYDGDAFYRVIPHFMAQTGSKTDDGTGYTGKHIPAEFNALKHERGAVSMAHQDGDDDSADCQFFIMLATVPDLDGKYTVWGRVREGMKLVDGIKKGSGDKDNGKVTDPDRMLRVRVAADLDGKG
jgi:peptidylprolyl isomerase